MSSVIEFSYRERPQMIAPDGIMLDFFTDRPQCEYPRAERKARLKAAMRSVYQENEQQFVTFMLCVLNQVSQQDLARQWNVSEPAVSQMKGRALTSLLRAYCG